MVLQRATSSSIPRPTAHMRRSITVATVPNSRLSIKGMMSTRRMKSNKSLTDDVDSVQELHGRRNSVLSQGSVTGQRPSLPVQSTVTREEFIEHYPQLLTDIMLVDEEDDDVSEMQNETLGIDICFKDLSLSVKIGNKQSAKVVDGVNGRIRAKTMTAILGGSGAGKTSLLNALCGRAYYGETKGSILVNGHEARIEEFKDSVGFVPQDDIVYAELTVRENLIFSGKFRLPKGTSDAEIEELADETLASLGLSRVADSPVGDIRRRGVSGGERKRVSIGLELMALPSICKCFFSCLQFFERILLTHPSHLSFSVFGRTHQWTGRVIRASSHEVAETSRREGWCYGCICHSPTSKIHLRFVRLFDPVGRGRTYGVSWPHRKCGILFCSSKLLLAPGRECGGLVDRHQ
jgi:ABC-type lipoprotein export system ATPase subunit